MLAVDFCAQGGWYYVLLVWPKTGYELRMSDWSSDVSSSDLLDRRTDRIEPAHHHHHLAAARREPFEVGVDRVEDRCQAPVHRIDVGGPIERPPVPLRVVEHPVPEHVRARRDRKSVV